MKNRYRITMTYDNENYEIEYADSISEVFYIISWYVKDPHIVMANVYNKLDNRNVFNWTR